MSGLKIGIALAGLVLLAACLPPDSGPEKATYEQHKANREAYKYQGI